MKEYHTMEQLQEMEIGSLVKLKGEVAIEGQWVYLMDYNDPTDDLNFLGVILKETSYIFDREQVVYDVLVNGEVVSAQVNQLVLVSGS
jgi:hypothetical protein